MPKYDETQTDYVISSGGCSVFGIMKTAKNPDTTPTPASWAIQKMQQYFPMNVNFMLNLSPNEKGKLDKNLEEEFARVGSLLSFPEPLTELPEDWLTRK